MYNVIYKTFKRQDALVELRSDHYIRVIHITRFFAKMGE